MTFRAKTWHPGRRAMAALSLCALAAVLAGCTALKAPAPEARGVIEAAVTFQSWSPGSHAGIVAGRDAVPETPVQGDLFLPSAATPERPVPGVVLLHGSSGFSNGYGRRIAHGLAEDGVAALVVYTYRSRGVMRRPDVQELAQKVPAYSQLADAFAALDFLSGEAGIDPRRIALAGFSTGGKMAVIAAIERVAAAFEAEGRRFAGHVSYWGVCDALFEDLPATGAPILILIGERDAVTPVGRCRELTQNLRDAGAPAEMIVYPEATHAWNGVDFAPRYFADRYNPAQCRWIMSGDGTIRETTTGTKGAWDDPALAAALRCLRRGFVIGKNEAATAQSRRDVVSFLSKLPESRSPAGD